MTISNDSRTRIKKVFEPIALGMGRLGPDARRADPDRVRDHRRRAPSWSRSSSGSLGGVVVLLGGVFDMFDGTLARATGKVSNLGAFMDSVFDRAGEVIVYLGIVVGLQSRRHRRSDARSLRPRLASAFMVSYARAKSEGLGLHARAPAWPRSGSCRARSAS